MVSQSEIAAELGISQRTVSSALNGSGRVGEAMRARILAHAAKAGYRPNHLASGLRGAKTSSIGIVWSFGDQWTNDSGIALDVTSRLQREGFAVYHALHDEDNAALCARIDDLLARSVDALVIRARRSQLASPEVRARLASVASVTVCNEAVSRLKCDQVVHDRKPAIREIADHFHASGRRRPAMILAMSDESNPPKFEAFAERWAEYGIEARLVDITDGGRLPHPSYAEHGAAHQAALRREFPDAARRAGPLPDCVFCFNDIGALHALRELRERGLSTPGDVAVCGFNNNPAGEAWDPPLATGDRCRNKVAEAVVALLERRRANHDAPFSTTSVPMRFLWRESAGGAPAQPQDGGRAGG